MYHNNDQAFWSVLQNQECAHANEDFVCLMADLKIILDLFHYFVIIHLPPCWKMPIMQSSHMWAYSIKVRSTTSNEKFTFNKTEIDFFQNEASIKYFFIFWIKDGLNIKAALYRKTQN